MGLLGSVCEKLVAGGIFVLLFFTPLLFGTIHPFTSALAETLILSLSALWLVRSLSHARNRMAGVADSAPFPLPAGVGVALVVFVALVAFQLLNLPAAVHAWLSPRSAELWEMTTRDLPPEAWRGLACRSTLTLYPFMTRIELTKVISAAAFFLLVLFCSRRPEWVRRCLWFAVMMGGLVALIGIAQRLSGTKEIYGFWVSEYGGTPFGPFPNRNDFAAYQNIVLPIGVALLFAGWEDRSTKPPPGWLAGIEPRLWTALTTAVSRALLATALALQVTALFMANSRGGIVGLATSVIVMSVLLSITRRGRARLAGLLLALVVLVCLAFLISGEDLIARFSSLPSERKDRLYIWRDCFKAARDFPLWGSGLGAFTNVFPIYKANPTTSRLVNHAHNEYIHLLMETGIAGTLAVVIALAVVFGRLLRFVRTPSAGREWWYAIGILSGLAGAMAHGYFTICIRVPANMYLAVAAAGLGLACVAQRHEGGNGSRLGRFGPWREVLIAVCATVAMGLVLPAKWKAFAAGSALQTARLAAESGASLRDQIDLLKRGARREPSYSGVPYETARAYDLLTASPALAAGQFDDHPPSLKELAEKALLNYQRAVASQPTNAHYHGVLGAFLARDPSLGPEQRALRGEAALKLAVYLAPNDDSHWTALGRFYRNLDRREPSLACFRAAADLRPWRLNHILTAMEAVKAPLEDIRFVLPDRPESYLEAANTIAADRKADARALVDSACGFPEARHRRETAARAAWSYLRIGEPQAAVDWMRQCLRDSPTDSALRRTLVTALIRSNQAAQAVAEGRSLVHDDPQSPKNHMVLADALIAQGHPDAAEDSLRKAARLAPSDFSLARTLCGLLKAGGKPKDAVLAARDFVQRNPDHGEAYGFLGSLYAEQGDADAALSAYAQASFLEPGNAEWRAKRSELLKRKGLEKQR